MYGELRKIEFPLPIWEKRRFDAKTPPQHTDFLTLSL